MKVDFHVATDVGRVRSGNEDSHGSWVSKDSTERERRGMLFAVADGMGGAEGGQVASRLAIESLIHSYEAARSGDVLEDLRHAFEEAHRAVIARSASEPSLLGMGTTCTAVVIRGREVFMANVGDSRAYLVRDGRIRQLSRDHSVVAHLVERKELTPEQARHDQRRNVVTRSIGVGTQVKVDAEKVEGQLERGDTLLICSDGLHGQVEDSEIAGLASAPVLEHACHQLIALANERGGRDNVTVLLARAENDGDGDRLSAPSGVDRARERLDRMRDADRPAAAPSRARTLFWLVVTVIALLVSAIALVWLLARLGHEAGALGMTLGSGNETGGRG